MRKTVEGNFQQAECYKLKEGDQAYDWSDTNSTWINTSFIRVCSERVNIVRLQAQRSVAVQEVYTKVERHAPAPAEAVSDARRAAAASGATRVGRDKAVVKKTMLHEFSEQHVCSVAPRDDCHGAE